MEKDENDDTPMPLMGAIDIDDVLPVLHMPQSVISAMEHSVLPIVVTERNSPFRIVFVNDKWERTCGYPSGSAVGSTCSRMQADGYTCRNTLKKLAEAVHGGKNISVSLLNTTMGGQLFMNNLSLTILTRAPALPSEALYVIGVVNPKYLDDPSPSIAWLNRQGVGASAAGIPQSWGDSKGLVDLARSPGLDPFLQHFPEGSLIYIPDIALFAQIILPQKMPEDCSDHLALFLQEINANGIMVRPAIGSAFAPNAVELLHRDFTTGVLDGTTSALHSTPKVKPLAIDQITRTTCLNSMRSTCLNCSASCTTGGICTSCQSGWVPISDVSDDASDDFSDNLSNVLIAHVISDISMKSLASSDISDTDCPQAGTDEDQPRDATDENHRSPSSTSSDESTSSYHCSSTRKSPSRVTSLRPSTATFKWPHRSDARSHIPFAECREDTWPPRATRYRPRSPSTKTKQRSITESGSDSSSSSELGLGLTSGSASRAPGSALGSRGRWVLSKAQVRS